MHFFDSILEWAGIKPKAYWEKTIAEITEQRDAFEEQCYDLRWERDNALEKASAHEQALEIVCDANGKFSADRDRWMGIAVSTEKQLKELRDAHAAELEQAGLSLKQLEQRAMELNEQAAIQLEMDGHRVGLEKDWQESCKLLDWFRVQMSEKEARIEVLESSRNGLISDRHQFGLERNHYRASYEEVLKKNDELLKRISAIEKTVDHHSV